MAKLLHKREYKRLVMAYSPVNMFPSLAVAVVLLPSLVQADANNFCYVCASDELKSRWSLTGLPRLADQYFTSSCQGNTLTNLKKESCAGPCFSLLFDDPDVSPESGSSSTSSTFFVRGCHSTLMQVTTNRSMSNGGAYCELDSSFPMADSRGTLKHVNMLMEFCSTNECNARKMYTDPACTQQTADLLNNQPIQCYECTPKQGSNCKESRCAKKYCMKRDIKLGGAYQTTKSCSNVNVVGIDNYCMKNEVMSTPGGVAVKNTYNQCFCKNKQFCNGAAFASLPLILGIFILF